jgi:hypothetical protein
LGVSKETPEVIIPPRIPDAANGLPLPDREIRARYADDAATADKLPYSDVPTNAPPNFTDFIGKLTMGAVGEGPPVGHKTQHELSSESWAQGRPERQASREARHQLQQEEEVRAIVQAEAGDPNLELADFAVREAARITSTVPPDGGLYEPRGQGPYRGTPAPDGSPSAHLGGNTNKCANRDYAREPWELSNHGGSPNSHRGQYSPPVGSTLNDSLPTQVKDEIIANLIAGRSAPYIQRLIKVRFSLVISSDAIYHYKKKDPYKSIIIAGRELRYESIRNEGLALIDERLILLQHNAEQLQLRIDEVMSTGGIPPLGLMKELRDTLDDIAAELGHRRKGIDVDNSIKVAVVRGPTKAASSEQWAMQADQHLADEVSSKRLAEQSSADSDLAQPSSDSTQPVN